MGVCAPACNALLFVQARHITVCPRCSPAGPHAPPVTPIPWRLVMNVMLRHFTSCKEEGITVRDNKNNNKNTWNEWRSRGALSSPPRATDAVDPVRPLARIR